VINPAYPATVPMATTTGTQPATGLPTGSSPAARYYEPPPSRTGWYALAAFFALVALGIGALLLFNALSGDREPGSRTLANYVGQPLDAVIADLDELGLTYRVQPEQNDTVAVGVVHRTDPAAGTVVVDGQVISLYFNPEPQLQAVPDVTGQLVDAATRTLGASGFTVGTQTNEENDDIAEGAVIRTDPPAGEQVRQTTPIDLVVSAGPAREAIPSSVIGQPEVDARTLLEGDPYNFNVTTAYEESDSVAPGLVIRTSPAVGELVVRGGDVTMVVSEGPQQVTVPDVRGLTEAQARAELSSFDVSVATRDLPFGDDGNGLVLSQSLSPGGLAPPGSSITIEVGVAATTPPTTDAPAPPPTQAPTTAAPTTQALTTTTAATEST
jgi:serine/threonine-protein kinase